MKILAECLQFDNSVSFDINGWCRGAAVHQDDHRIVVILTGNALLRKWTIVLESGRVPHQSK